MKNEALSRGEGCVLEDGAAVDDEAIDGNGKKIGEGENGDDAEAISVDGATLRFVEERGPMQNQADEIGRLRSTDVERGLNAVFGEIAKRNGMVGRSAQ